MSEISNAQISACCRDLEINTRDAEPPSSASEDAANGLECSTASKQLPASASGNGNEVPTSLQISPPERRSIVEIVVEEDESTAYESNSPKEVPPPPQSTPALTPTTSVASFALDSPGTPDDLPADAMVDSASACSSPPLELSSPSKESASPLGIGEQHSNSNDTKELNASKPISSTFNKNGLRSQFCGTGAQNFSSSSIFAEFNNLMKKSSKAPGGSGLSVGSGGQHQKTASGQPISPNLLVSKALLQSTFPVTGYTRANSAIYGSKALHERLKQTEEGKRHSTGEEKNINMSQRTVENAATDPNVASSSLNSEQSLESLLEEEDMRPRICSIGSGESAPGKEPKPSAVAAVAPECMSLKEEGLLDGGSKAGRGMYLSRFAANPTASALYRLKSGAPLASMLSSRFARYTSKAEYFSNAYPSLYGAPGAGGADGELSERDAPEMEGLSARGQSPANLSRLSDTSTTNLLEATARAEKAGRGAQGAKEDERCSLSGDECDSACEPLAAILGKRAPHSLHLCVSYTRTHSQLISKQLP